MGFPQGGGEVRVGRVIGAQGGRVFLHNNEDHAGFHPGMFCLDEPAQVLGAPGGGSVGEDGDAAFVEERHALDFDQAAGFRVCGRDQRALRSPFGNLRHFDCGLRFARPVRQVKPGIAPFDLALHLVDVAPAALFDPRAGDQVRALAVDVDHASVLFHRDQVVGGLAGGIAGLFQPACRAGDEQLLQAAGVLHMDDGFLAVHQTFRNKAIDPAQKAALGQIMIEDHFAASSNTR